MMFEPCAVIVYVSNISISSQFYQDLLGISPEVLSPAFITFKLSNGMLIGLKDKNTLQPEINGFGGYELAFTVTTDSEVDSLFSDWKRKNICFAQEPVVLPYGYTFVALDPDNNRLRVVAQGNQEH
ncbi:VOC family protein [Legionella dresdenensis]|uniref:VOC family protein n=1 Tax=Legionella dresdenensis TaxID=450200 RepID=A0ABV8CGH2_9GAMM